MSACRSSIARARSATRSEKLGTARDGCFGRRESDLIPNRIFTSSTDSGVWCRSSTSKGNCCITSGGREPGPNSFNCRPDLISTTTIASMLWIPLTGACRCFNTTVPRKRRTGGNNREAAPVTSVHVHRCPEFCPGAAHRGCTGHAQPDIVEWRIRLFARKPGLHFLPCSAQWAGRQHTALEPEAVAEILCALQQHDRSYPGQHPAHAGCHQQPVLELS